MKQFLLIFFVLFSYSSISQQTYIPDDGFEQALIDTGYDSGPLDNYVTTANISSITSLQITNSNISDLTGLQDFVSLTGLHCQKNNITLLNVNHLPNLTVLYCHENQISNLDLSNNTKITFLNVGTNKLTEIDVSMLSLFDFKCESNQIDSLHLSGQVNLSNLECGWNPLSYLKLDKTNFLSNLNVPFTDLINLDLSKCSGLTSVYASNNSKLKSIDVRNGNNIGLTSFYAYEVPKLTCVFVDDPNLQQIQWWSIASEVKKVINEAECNDTPVGTYIPDDNFEQALIDLGYDSGALDDYVPTENISSLTDLNINSKQIKDLTGIEDFSALQRLFATENKLDSVNFESNYSIQSIYLEKNQIVDINVGQNYDLLVLQIDDNKLSTIDLAGNPYLNTFTGGKNQLTSLNMSNNIALISFNCSDNQLTSLDMRNGNNHNMSGTFFNALSNPDLKCIFVDNPPDDFLENWLIDATSSFVKDEAACETVRNKDLNSIEFTITPNPASHNFSIQLDSEIKNVQIFDVFGQQIANYKNQPSYSINHLSKGLYLIEIQTNEGIGIKKLIIE